MQVEHKEQLIAFYKISGDRETHGKNLLAVVEAGNAKWGSVKSWGAYGLCWGGKVSHFDHFHKGRVLIISARCHELCDRNTFLGNRSSSSWVNLMMHVEAMTDLLLGRLRRKMLRKLSFLILFYHPKMRTLRL